MKSKNESFLLFAVCLVATVCMFGCDESVEREVELDHYKAPCYGMTDSLCILIDEGEGFEFYYGEIEGFTFEWGNTYKLRVLVEEVSNPPADGSSLKYSLEEVLEKTPVNIDTIFDFPVEHGDNPLLSMSDAHEGTLLDGTAFVCDSQEICDQLTIALQSEQNFNMEFGYSAGKDTGTLPLVVSEVQTNN